jgi:outer membrane protein assembly factor BamD (BamD/ComL family)
MTLAGIFNTPYASSFTSSSIQNQNTQPNSQQFQQSFSQLGQDLQSGNLSAAEQDFLSLQQVNPQSSSTSSTASTSSNNPITQAFQQLQTDLQSGNLTGAQQTDNNAEPDFQTQNQTGQSQQTGQTEGHHHHRHGGGEAIDQLLQIANQSTSPTSTGSSTTQQTPFSFLTQLPYNQPLGQSTGVSSLSFTA